MTTERTPAPKNRSVLADWIALAGEGWLPEVGKVYNITLTPQERDTILSALRSEIQPSERPCTCHPDDNPPVPCPKKYALNECRAASVCVVDPFERSVVNAAMEWFAWTVEQGMNETDYEGHSLTEYLACKDLYNARKAATPNQSERKS